MKQRIAILSLTCALLSVALYLGSCGYSAPGYTKRLEAGSDDEGRVTAGPRPGLDQEIWVIAREGSVTSRASDEPGQGTLLARVDDLESVPVPIPLEHTDVRAEITSFVATVAVGQRFSNPYSEKIEAVYTFPLPENSAVHEFVMTIGERRIRGIIREREEAERVYLEARRQGYVASLLVQDRPNVFTETVANIEPGEAIEIDIRYVHTLSWHDGWFEYRFPMVVAPRFNPESSTDGIGAVPRELPDSSGQATEVSYLHPSERSGHDISLAVELETGIRAQEIHSPTHSVEIEGLNGHGNRIVLSEHDSIPNRDFVLRYRLGGDRTRGALMTSSAGDEGTFSLLVMPPQDLTSLPREAIELILVIDRSGSMEGESMELARRAARHALSLLRPGDTFNLLSFANDSDRFRRRVVPVGDRELRAARAWLDELEAGGGTYLAEAVRLAFRGESSGEHKRCVAFLTDGHVGNEAEVLSLLVDRLGTSRVFSFAVGSASNQYLAESMARLGRGAVAYIGEGDDPEWVMRTFLERVSCPALTDLAIDWGGLQVSDVQPARLPDILAGRPVIISGRYRGRADGPVHLEGRAGRQPIRLALDASLEASTQEGIPFIWARRKLAELHDRALVHDLRGEESWRREVQGLALEYGLLSDYTAFLAVDSSRRTEGDGGVTVPVPVPVPKGMRYETTVGAPGERRDGR